MFTGIIMHLKLTRIKSCYFLAVKEERIYVEYVLVINEKLYIGHVEAFVRMHGNLIKLEWG